MAGAYACTLIHVVVASKLGVRLGQLGRMRDEFHDKDAKGIQLYHPASVAQSVVHWLVDQGDEGSSPLHANFS